MTKNETTIDRHGSIESSWSSRSGDTVRPYGRHGSLRGTPVTVKTSKDLNAPYVFFRCACKECHRCHELHVSDLLEELHDLFDLYSVCLETHALRS